MSEENDSTEAEIIDLDKERKERNVLFGRQVFCQRCNSVRVWQGDDCRVCHLARVVKELDKEVDRHNINLGNINEKIFVSRIRKLAVTFCEIGIVGLTKVWERLIE